MTHPRPYRPFSTCPHTYGVRRRPCSAIATEPCRPTACAGERPHLTAYPPPFRHTPGQSRPRHTATVWQNPGRHPHRDGTFTFSAKGRDPETGLSYFGSRYYSSDLSIWLSVDPMADKYPSLSPYTYCANNPIKLVDPNGEAWEVNQDGYIRQCGDENDHTLYAVKGRKDEFGDRILYKYGKLKGKERSTPVSVDVMSKMISDKTQHWDVMSRRYIEHDYTKLEFIGNRGIDEAKKLICFLSKNTDVEWSIVGGSYQKDISTLICTSHFEKKEYMGADRAALMAPFNNLYFFFHTHPKNEIFGWLSNEKDRAVCRALACDYNSPQALFGVIHKGVFFDLHGTRILKRNVW